MPKTSCTYELLFKSDPALQQTALGLIEQQFGQRPHPIYENTDDPYFRDFYKISLPTDKNKWELAREIMSIEGVIEVDPVEKIFGIYNRPRNHDDRSQDTRWNHELTRFPEAIEFSRQEGRLKDKTDITVVQLDTGYALHPEILQINAKDGRNFLDGEDPGNALDILNSALLQQPGHGTSTAGIIIGQSTQRSDDKNVGVFPYVNFVPYRIAPSVIHFFNSNIAWAIKIAVDNGADVITMSMGGAPPRAGWRRAVRYALKKGVIFVAAAGNEVKFVIWPARYSEVVAVGGVNHKGLPWEGSCRGKDVTISAPGENVFVAKVQEKDKYYYTYGSGTSYATPHVASAAAMWLNHYREELQHQVFTSNPHMKVYAFHDALKRSANLPSAWSEKDKKKYGAGILDARKLLDFSPLSFAKANFHLASRDITPEEEEEEVPSLLQKELFQLILESDASEKNGLLKDVKSKASEEAYEQFKVLYADKMMNNRDADGTPVPFEDARDEMLESI